MMHELRRRWPHFPWQTMLDLLGGDASGRVKTVPRLTEWNVRNQPAVGNQASITKAGVAGVRHVITWLSADFAQTAAAISTQSVVIRDGASGVGGLKHSWTLSVDGANGHVDRLVLAAPCIFVGTAGNDTTLEFFAANAGIQQGVTMAGFDLTIADGS